MPDNIFNSIFSSSTTTTASSALDVPNFLICVFVSLLIGLFLALTYIYKSRYTKSFVVTLALLPAVVCVVIMMVNGNIGAGVAVAGAFSLVRFRSVPGTAKEIGAIFIAMGTGLIAGMGYLAYAVLFAVIVGLVMVIYYKTGFGSKKSPEKDKTLRVTIPEDLDYTNIFEDLFKEYTDSARTVSVKTTNMGSLFKITYHITLKDLSKEKEMIDAMRCRNGNLEISISEQEVNNYEL